MKIFQRCHEQRGGAHVVGEQSLRIKTEFRRAGKLIERIPQCLRPLCTVLVAAGTLAALNDEPDVAWSERTTTVESTGGFCPTCAAVASGVVPLVRRTGYYQQVFDSASNRDKYLPHFGGTSPLPVCLCRSTACCLPSQGIRWTCSPHPSQCTRSRSSSNRCAAGPCGAQFAQSTCSSFFSFFLFCFLKLALRRQSRPSPPSPKRTLFVSQASANFCDGP